MFSQELEKASQYLWPTLKVRFFKFLFKKNVGKLSSFSVVTRWRSVTRPTAYQMNVHLFEAISSPGCSNYALKRTAENFEEDESAKAADVLRKNFYVDDCLGSEETVELAIERIDGVIRTCARGGFHLTKVTSNKRSILEAMP